MEEQGGNVPAGRRRTQSGRKPGTFGQGNGREVRPVSKQLENRRRKLEGLHQRSHPEIALLHHRRDFVRELGSPGAKSI